MTLANMLMMQTITMRESSFRFKLKLSDEEVLHIQEELRTRFHKVQNILRTIVLSMLLVLRYKLYFKPSGTN